ncbi:hypothetical protein ASPBRDRAFT_445744 [Aspergillus brasiliensis CBS 101740]|uniref:Uncharacterized protein n=1 Tax=Aspergillus brasiliensis (strain CBS 101740 / IMI 381727 / IBT 21946) TaxID=767769 RepID=A0A1L9URL9_ASPBC|nr:hypothetical protein ASPBRDRAFT_445744 [Aspergillus brasiliensis CBS 101740]
MDPMLAILYSLVKCSSIQRAHHMTACVSHLYFSSSLTSATSHSFSHSSLASLAVHHGLQPSHPSHMYVHMPFRNFPPFHSIPPTSHVSELRIAKVDNIHFSRAIPVANLFRGQTGNPNKVEDPYT